ncbi:hypothetical protein [Methylocystis sp. B8]|uniref:hypothetical protein n=1 Tax=Methylocystis sp. B8 TaxID=544938 RepID=UPI0010FDD3BC|nr:hypothetical protein [Methylocystis sp. B8]TLG72787.1 hypothetical protein FEV16_13585 [Methylocystis sp. B8]
MNRPFRVYLAGKITKNGWRCKIAPRYRSVSDTEAFYDSELELETITPEVVMSGPFAISCDHGCFRGDGSHGIGGFANGYKCDGAVDLPDDVRWRRVRAFEINERRLERADAVFAYLDGPNPTGTVFELGHAWKAGKPIFLAFAPDIPRNDFWYPAEAADEVVTVNDVEGAWGRFADSDDSFLARRFAGTAGGFLPRRGWTRISLREPPLNLDNIDAANVDLYPGH